MGMKLRCKREGVLVGRKRKEGDEVAEHIFFRERYKNHKLGLGFWRKGRKMRSKR